MKRKFLLLFGALASVFTTAFAWEKPAAPASQPLATDGTEQYLYNPGTGGFMLGANDWNTRASVSLGKGYQWKVEVVDENLGTYTLTDLCETKGDVWLRMFCADINGIWVDNNEGANNNTWTIALGDGNIFTIGNTAFEGLLGANAADGYRLCFTSHEANISTEWYSVSLAEYDRYIAEDAAKLLAYNAAMELKAAIDEALAKYPNLDIAAQQAVYNNEASTAEELKAATEAVKAAVVQADKDAAKQEAIANASVNSPYDMTTYIVNPNFDNKDWTTGWSGNKWGGGGNTADCAERYEMTFDTYQDIEGLPKGVYRILVNGFFRGNEANTPYLYGASTSDTLKINIPLRDAAGSTEKLNAPNEQEITINDVKYYVPNSMADFVIYEEAGFYNDVNIVVPVNEDGKLRIGVKKEKNTGGDWVIVDSFRLLYLGDAAEAYQEIMNGQLAGFPDYTDVLVTESVIDEYNAVIQSHNTASNMDDVRANVAAIKEAAKAVEENIAAWAKFQAKLATAQETLQDESLDATADAVLALGDFVMEAEDAIALKALTTEELEAKIAELDELINAVMNSLKSGADITRYLKNPQMNNGQGGWQGDPTINSNCGEKYGSGEFDVYQIVDEDVPVGLYEISMQGFYRQYRDDNADKTAWKNIFQETDDARTYKVAPEDREAAGLNLAYVYMNSNKTPMNCVYDFAKEGVYDAENDKFTCDFYGSGYSVDPYNKYAYPNTMANAAAAFAEGAYKVSAYGIVAKAGDKLRIGVKGNLGNTGNCWAIFDNFELTFRAKDAAIINKLLPDAKASINIEGKFIGKDVKELVITTLDAAENAATNDEKFNALALCFDLKGTVEASEALFKELYAAIGELETAIGMSESSEETKTKAGLLMDKVNLGYNGEYTDAEAKEAIKQIEEMIKALAIPEFIGSDDNPVDLTAFIKDANFDGLSVSGNNYGAWTWTKKEGNGPKFTDAFEFWAGSASNLEFTLTQELVGLPAAKYELKAQAANSFNGQANTEAEGRAYLFAEVGADKVGHSVAVEPKEGDATEYDEYSVTFTVAEGDVVTIGFKTVGTMCARWFSGDSFQLWCYGSESTKNDTQDAASIEEATTNLDAAVVPVAIYNAAGAKLPALQKGLNIMRMSNGKTLKVIVK